MIKEIAVTGKFTEDFSHIEILEASKLRRVLHPFGDDTLEVNLKKFRKNRTNRQNRYIWGVVIPTVLGWMKETNGEAPTKDGLYAHLRVHVVGHEVVIERIDGRDSPVVKGKRFSHMTTTEFAEAIDKIVAHYAERGLEIPLPKDENLIENFV